MVSSFTVVAEDVGLPGKGPGRRFRSSSFFHLSEPTHDSAARGTPLLAPPSAHPTRGNSRSFVTIRVQKTPHREATRMSASRHESLPQSSFVLTDHCPAPQLPPRRCHQHRHTPLRLPTPPPSRERSYARPRFLRIQDPPTSMGPRSIRWPVATHSLEAPPGGRSRQQLRSPRSTFPLQSPSRSDERAYDHLRPCALSSSLPRPAASRPWCCGRGGLSIRGPL